MHMRPAKCQGNSGRKQCAFHRVRCVEKVLASGVACWQESSAHQAAHGLAPSERKIAVEGKVGSPCCHRAEPSTRLPEAGVSLPSHTLCELAARGV